MQRRTFIARTVGLMLAIAVGPKLSAATTKDDRLGMSTVTFRNRFRLTRPADAGPLRNELTLFDVPEYYRDRFGIRNLELWGHHFESLEPAYLAKLRSRIDAAKAQVINLQADADYDLASRDEAERQRSLRVAFQWVDAAVALGSRAVRINPGRPDGSVENAIASMKEINRYCRAKGLPLLIENHFGIEMDPAVHLRIRAEAGPENVYTLPDFGNYPVETMWEALEKILPHAYLVSAKTVEFNENLEHVTYDFDRCVQMAERAGFKGIYSVEQWSREDLRVDPEQVIDWMLEHVRANI